MTRSLFRILPLVLLLGAGCGSGDLSRSEAKAALQAHFETDDSLVYTLPVEFQESMKQVPETPEQVVAVINRIPPFSRGGLTYQDLENRGLVRAPVVVGSERQGGPLGDVFPGYWVKYRMPLTDEGKALVIRPGRPQYGVGGLGERETVKVVLGEIQVHEVTGITEPAPSGGVTQVTATYVYGVEPTAFGEVLLPSEIKAQRRQRQARFALYDDGWRLEASSV